jgi:uncharacterized protein YjiS (DUF1127 family)
VNRSTFAWLGVISLCFICSQPLASGSTIWLDADPGGTTSNVNIQSATFDSVSQTVTNWGNYRDYRFELASSPQATLTDFGLRLSVNKSSGFSASLNVTWFADSITPYAANPDFTTALGTISASDIPTVGGYPAYVIGPGPYKAQVTVPTTKTAYWVRLWAATSGGNDKYQTKLTDNISLEYTSNDASLTMYNFDEGSGQYSTTAATQTTNITPVPEPAALALFVAAAGTLACRWRRRRAGSPQ